MSPRSVGALMGAGWAALAAALLLGGCADREPGLASHPRERGRVHGLVRQRHAEVPWLGLVTGMRASASGGVIAAGPGGAVRVDAAGTVERLASAPRRLPSTVEPLALGEQVALVGRGTDGSLTLYDAGGRARARAPEGAHDLTGGDLDGDGNLDLVAGLSKREGLRRMDPQGRARWTRSAVDPWEIELADLSGNGRPEIVHSNRQGAFVVRDADGRVLNHFETERMARHFAVVNWPNARPHILQRSGDSVDLYTAQGEEVARLQARVSNNHARVDAVSFDPQADGRRWLAVLDRLSGDVPSVLTVFDSRGRRIHEEVFLEPCASVGALDDTRLLVGCEGRLWRYEFGRVDPATFVSVPEARRSGDAFGPLRFGDMPGRVRAMSTLLPGHNCRLTACDSSYLEVKDRQYLMVPEFDDEGLSRVALMALPEPEGSYDETRKSWDALLRLVSSQYGRPVRGSRRFPSIEAVERTPPEAGWRPYRTHRWRNRAVQIELGVASLDDEGPLQYMAYASFSPGRSRSARGR